MFDQELPLLTVAGFVISLAGVLLTRPARRVEGDTRPRTPAGSVRSGP
jgi:hypothetical protein